MNHLRMDLKVCEGCGTLWLRRITPNGTNTGVYCSSCAARLAEFPLPRGKHAGGRKPRGGREFCISRSARHNNTAAAAAQGGAR